MGAHMIFGDIWGLDTRFYKRSFDGKPQSYVGVKLTMLRLLNGIQYIQYRVDRILEQLNA